MTIAQERPVDAADNDPPRTLAELNTLITSSKPLVAGATRGVLGEGRLVSTKREKAITLVYVAQSDSLGCRRRDAAGAPGLRTDTESLRSGCFLRAHVGQRLGKRRQIFIRHRLLAQSFVK